MSEKSGSSSQPTKPETGAKDQGGGTPPAGGGRPPGPGQPPPQSAGAGERTPDNPLRGSLTSGVWIATAGVGILLVLLVIFIVQNTQEVDIAYLAWEGRLPLAAGLLIAAAAGILITTTAGGLRILQLRHRVKRETKAAQKAQKTPKAPKAPKGDKGKGAAPTKR